MKSLSIPAEEFLRPFYSPSDKICLRVFAARNDAEIKGMKLETTIAAHLLARA